LGIETELKAPTFLIAVPQLIDPNFLRSVVLLLEHQDQGSMGLVINRPTDLTVGEFCDSQEMPYNGDGSRPVFSGGPVQPDRAFLIHDSEHDGPETEVVTPSLRLSYSLESLEILSQSPPDRLRVYLGYAGWGPGQLADEVTTGAWLVSQISDSLIFETEPESIWELALRAMGIEPVQLMHSGAVH